MTANKKSKALYICYFGLREPLVQTQVIPYLLEIIKDQVEISLLTFEPDLAYKWKTEEIEAERRQLKIKGIVWHHLAYHKSPSVPATLLDILNGARTVRSLIRSENFDILHGRVHVATLMAVIARRFSRRKPRILFDIRGFFPEEYTDAGVWPENGWLYRAAKRVEKWLFDEADAFVVLTENARQILFPESAETGFDARGRPVAVIPCCVDLKRFDTINDEARKKTRQELRIGNRYVIAYIGSFGGWYLSDEMFDLFDAARGRDPSIFILILTQRQTELAVKRLKNLGFDENDFFVDSVSPADLPRYLTIADAAVSLIKRCYSKQASSPTKNAEYLACGVPIIANCGVGDVDELIEQGVGVWLEDFSEKGYINALTEINILGDSREKCRKIAGEKFDLESVGGQRYRDIYKQLQ